MSQSGWWERHRDTDTYTRTTELRELSREWAADTQYTSEELRARQLALREDFYARHPELRPGRNAA